MFRTVFTIFIVLLCTTAQASNVFFVHTSAETSPGVIESCSIESAARKNPDKDIIVYSNSFRDVDVEILGSNVKVRRFSYRDEFSKASTELSRWFESGKWREGFCLNNLSNSLRLALLSTQGGTYFDMDIISVGSVERAGSNAVGKETEEHYCNAGLLNWSPRHPLLEVCMKDLVLNFNPVIWGNQGPKLFDRVMSNLSLEQQRKNVTQLKSHVLYTVPWFSLYEFFVPKNSNVGEELLNRLESKKDIVGLHLWASQIRKKIQVEMNRDHRSDAVLWSVFEKYCPRTSASFLPQSRRPENEEFDFNLYVTRPNIGDQYFGVKSVSPKIWIRANSGASVNQENTCVCVVIEGGLSESKKDFCVSWKNLRYVPEESVESLRKRYVSKKQPKSKNWRLLEFEWSLESKMTGYYKINTYVSNCDETALSDVAFSTWTVNFLYFYDKLQEDKCEQYFTKSIINNENEGFRNFETYASRKTSMIIEATYRVTENDTRSLTYNRYTQSLTRTILEIFHDQSSNFQKNLTAEMRELVRYITIESPDYVSINRPWPRLEGVRTYTPTHRPSVYRIMPYMLLPPETRTMSSSELESLTSYSESIAIIVPYRNREAHLQTFLSHMKRFLNLDDDELSKKIIILIVEQADSLPFNRGWLLNVGSHIVTQESGLLSPFMLGPAKTLILHDVDMLPVEDDLRSFYERVPPLGTAYHMLNPFQSSSFDHMYQVYGGVNVFRTENFLKDLNGFRNDMYGWGLEDCILRQRSSVINLKTIRPWKGSYRTLFHESNRNDKLLMHQKEYLQHDFQTMKENGLSNIDYHVQRNVRAFDGHPRAFLIRVSRVGFDDDDDSEL